MKKCSVYLRNKELDPSSYYRIGQYLPYLNNQCIIHNLSTNKEFSKNLQIKKQIVKKLYQFFLYIRMVFRIFLCIWSDSLKKVDTIFIQRTILPRHLPFLLLLCIKQFCRNKTVIWDFDDNIIQSGEISKSETSYLAKKAKRIIVTSCFLKETLPNSAFDKVLLSSTTDIGLSEIYSDSVIQEREKTYSSSVNLIWIGTGGNLKFLYDIIEYLDNAANELKRNYFKKLNLYIICNIPLKTKTKDLIITNILWTREIVNDCITKVHIGIMPLQDTYYTRGKAGFKLVQYMATGLPVIGSKVGYNSSVVDGTSGILIPSSENSKWADEIINLSTNVKLWKELSFGARNKFMTDFNPQRNIDLLNSCINN